MKVSDRKLSLQTKNARLRRIYKRLQIAGDDEERGRDKGIDDEAKVSLTVTHTEEVRSSSTTSFDHEGRRGGLMTKPCSCKEINPGLYLLLVTLFFTVVWGRVRAVLLALVFLYSFPVWAGFLR